MLNKEALTRVHISSATSRLWRMLQAKQRRSFKRKIMKKRKGWRKTYTLKKLYLKKDPDEITGTELPSYYEQVENWTRYM